MAGVVLAVAVALDGAALCVEDSRAKDTAAVSSRVDWPEFLKRHDLIWETPPGQFDHGAFLGNGLLGAMIYSDGPNRLRWEMGRSDVTEHRRDNNRLPIGGMVLHTAGRIQSGTIRLDLWHAEVRGDLTTDKGTLKFRSLIHTEEMFLLVELETSDGEKDAKFSWSATPAVDAVNASFKDPPNPPSRTDTEGDVSVCVQPRVAGGEFATAWKEVPLDATHRRLFLSIADSLPGNTAKQDAVASVERAGKADLNALVERHRNWWHSFYPKSFVSVPDTKVESFYWAQMYKLGCATRSDRPVMDLLGPWFRNTGWPRIWWNLNIEICYLPVYASNHLEIGESLVRFLDGNRANFVRNAKEIWKFDDCATVPHTTCYEGLRGNGSRAPQGYINPGDFTWALHDYWLHYRFSMDENIITDQQKHAFYPLLRGSVNLYLKLLVKGDDGKLHLPTMHSPEYGDAKDNNYNLALLRWGCQTLLDLNRRYKLNDALVPEWENVLQNLVDYPRDENGMRIGANVPFSRSHRHWSQMLMMYPLYLMNWEQPEHRDLMRKSVEHWLSVQNGREIYGWSRAAASSLYSAMGDGDKALFNLHKHLSDKRFVMPNTMYIEGSPVIECALFAAKSLQDMLVQSWGGTIRVFPALPTEWKDAVFHDLRTEGAFLVSAERKGGKTRWVRIRSLGGEPCHIRSTLDGDARATVGGKDVSAKALGDGVYELGLAKDEEALLYAGDRPQAPTVEPLVAAAEDCNQYGVKVRKKKDLKLALSSGKPAKASSIWSAEYDAAKAFDDDDSTRWGAAPNSRSGWLEVDLQQDALIGRAVIMEIGFPRTEEFAIEYKAGDMWKELVHGTTIAGEKTFDFAPVTARYVRLTILRANEVPTLEEFRVLPPASKATP
ncbi:MAG: discoidin domain-containing protein [Planctomycetota bacterium]|nr:discoidin domain-containing protein [Planctomycetota bacterium]